MAEAQRRVRYCEAPDCEREADCHDGKARRYCAAHQKRVQRGHAIGESIAERLTPYERALKAWEVHLEAEEDAEYRKTRRRALVASRAWARAEEKRPRLVRR